MPTLAVRAPSDRTLLLVSAGLALGLALVTDQPAHRVWGVVAAGGYLLVAACRPGRCAPWAAGVAAGAVPLGALVLARSSAGPTVAPDAFAQPEVRLVETAARRWLAAGSPWPSPVETAGAAGVDGYFPYLPGTALLGMPRALLGDAWWTDARLVFALVVLACLAVAARLLRRTGTPGRWAGWLAAGNPVVALTVATGGHDLPTAGLLVLAFACAAAHGAVPWCGAVAGLALCAKPTAWPVVAVLAVFVWRRYGTRVTARAALVTASVLLAVCLPPVLRSGPGVVGTQLVAFPAGLAAVPIPVSSPLPGGWIAALPHGRTLALVVLGLVALLVVVHLWRRPPSDALVAAGYAAAALTTAIALAPSSRIGWLVTPALLLAVAAMSRHAPAERVSVVAWVCSSASPRTPPPPPSRNPPSSGATTSGAPS